MNKKEICPLIPFLTSFSFFYIYINLTNFVKIKEIFIFIGNKQLYDIFSSIFSTSGKLLSNKKSGIFGSNWKTQCRF